MLNEERTEVASEDDLLNDDEIQNLLAQAQSGASPAAEGNAPADGSGAEGASAENPAAAAAVSQEVSGGGAGDQLDAGASASVETAGGSLESRTDQLLDAVDAGLDAAISGKTRTSSNVASHLDGAEPFDFAEFDADGGASEQSFSIGALDEVELDLHIELGRAELLIDEVMALREGAVVPLDKLAGDPVDILVNGRLLARGEVLVLNDNFCVRVAEIVAPDF